VEQKSGWLWFDDNPRITLQDKLERAARRYAERFGSAPTVCYVHPKMLQGANAAAGSIQVIESCTIQPNHFWLGVAGTHSRP
jgi:hypothetical protein